jgi:two-component system NtrC family sensor kinase
VAERLRQGFAGLTNPVTRPLIEGARVVHIPDLAEVDHPIPQTVAKLGGFHTGLFVPLRKDGRLLGHISAARSEVRPFSEKEIALLENFTAQAVIAMENARLLNELQDRTRDLQESLEYQTATSDVLKVINRSTFDLQLVLDTLVETAARLCDANMSHLFRREGNAYRCVATHSLTPGWDAIVRERLLTPGRETLTGRTALEGQVVHIRDIAADPEYNWAEAVSVGRLRTALGVPLLRGLEVIGVFVS